MPTNVQLLVTYWPGGNGVPAFGPDLQLLDADGSPISAAVDVDGASVVIRPDADLLPNHGYQLADRRSLPCDALPQGGCALLAAPQVFASFTTGAGPDTVAPTFAGITDVAVPSHLTCDNDACCGTYDVYSVELSWAPAQDDSAADVRYNVYRRSGPSLTRKATLVAGTSFTGVRTCSGSLGGTPLEPGNYIVRAVDGAGNEDANTIERHLDDPCGSLFGCAVVTSTPSSRLPEWAAIAVLIVALWRGSRRRSGTSVR